MSLTRMSVFKQANHIQWYLLICVKASHSFLLLLPNELASQPSQPHQLPWMSSTRPVTSIWRQNSGGNDGSTRHCPFRLGKQAAAGVVRSTFHPSFSFPRLEMCHTCNITSRRLSYPLRHCRQRQKVSLTRHESSSRGTFQSSGVSIAGFSQLNPPSIVCNCLQGGKGNSIIFTTDAKVHVSFRG